MTTYHGKNGVVKITTAVAEVQEFTVTETVSTVDDTAMGDAAETHLVGITAWTGTLKCSRDFGDAAQGALTVGASVDLKLYPAGTGSGQELIEGTATVTQIADTVNRSAVNAVSFDFKGNGALSKSAI